MASLEERRGGGNKKDLLKRDREKWGGGGGARGNGGVRVGGFEEVFLEKVWWPLVLLFLVINLISYNGHMHN